MAGRLIVRCVAALLAATLAVGFCPAANAERRPASKSRSAWEIDMRRAERSIPVIVARQDPCKTADRSASVGTIMECDWAAAEASWELESAAVCFDAVFRDVVLTPRFSRQQFSLFAFGVRIRHPQPAQHICAHRLRSTILPFYRGNSLHRLQPYHTLSNSIIEAKWLPPEYCNPTKIHPTKTNRAVVSPSLEARDSKVMTLWTASPPPASAPNVDLNSKVPHLHAVFAGPSSCRSRGIGA